MRVAYPYPDHPNYPVLPLLTAVFFFSLCAVLVVAGPYINTAYSDALLGKTFVVDAGHGGFDGGAIGVTGAVEAPLTLAVSRELKSQLTAMGAKVIMTRTDDEALGNTKKEDMNVRAEILSQEGLTAGVLIHMNNFTDPQPNGPRVFYNENSEEAFALATALQNALDDAVGLERKDPLPSNNMLLKCGAQANVLIECGFLSNPEDERLLKTLEHQRLLAKTIAETLADYYAAKDSHPAAGFEIAK